LGQVLRSLIQSPLGSALHLCPQHWKTVRALAACRTSALGGQLFRCTNCQREHFVAHSCRNRHCPQCQGARAVDWLQQQEAALLPIPYFHVVFTLPHTLNGVLRQNRQAFFKLLFGAASQTLREFGVGGSRRNWASPPSCTPGARLCWIIITCTASSPAAAWPWTAGAG